MSKKYESKKNMRKKRFFMFLLIIFITAIVSVALISYARYKNDDLNGAGSVKIAKWNVVVTDNKTKDSIAGGITFVVNNQNQEGYIMDDVIAPGSEAVATVTLDPSGSEVAIDYSIEMPTKILETKGLSIKDITATIDDEPLDSSEFSLEDGIYKGFLSLQQVKNNKKVVFVITAEWKNDENNNKDDTLVGEKAYENKKYKINIPIVIKATQHIFKD